MKIRLQLTETIPEEIEEGILYVSLTYWTTAHKCGCGCGQKVVLRLGPKHWSITLNGESVSMYPSVGNWQLPCRSHYWIEEGEILQARRWSDEEILRNRAMTKGRRTPYQTPRSRLYSPLQIGNRLEISAGQNTPDPTNDTAGTTGEAKGGADFASRCKDLTKAVFFRWWNRAKNAIH